jgi:hypothetical protein
MFSDLQAVCLVYDQQHQERVAKADRRRLIAEITHRRTTPRRWTLAVVAPFRLVASALSRLGTLAYDGRETVRSKEQELAGFGVTWTADPAHERELAEELRAVLSRRAAASSQYPTLAAIDRAREGARPRFAAAANAAELERRARDLTNQYWSESAWLTGHVPATAFERVCAALESARIAATETAGPLTVAELAGESALPIAA